MITLIISIVCFLLLFVVCFFAPVQNSNTKTLIMAGIVMAMLLVTIVDELVLPKYPLTRVKSSQHFQKKPLSPNLQLNITTQLYKNSPARTLLKQQRTLLTYLTDKETAKQNIIIYVKNIDISRFRAIFREFQVQTSVPAVFVDFKMYDYSFSDLQASLKKYTSKITYLLVQNIATIDHATALQNIFLTHNTSFIFTSFPPTLLQLSTLGKWTSPYMFQGNYIQQVLQNHPPRLVQICNKYRTIDYPFYVMSQTQPLSQLCTKLPTNQVTQCIRQHLKSVDDRVPFNKVRKCFKNDDSGYGSGGSYVQGVVYDNGMIGVKKDYYYAGKVDRSIFGYNQQENNQGL